MSKLNEGDKLYYSIGEVADKFKVSRSLIRYWESEFTFLSPLKNSKGDRRYTKKHIDQLQLVYDLVKVEGYTLDGAKNKIKEVRKYRREQQAIKNRLIKIKNGLIKLDNSL